MKKKISLVLALVIAICLAGCGEKAQMTEEKKPVDLSRPAKVQKEDLPEADKTEEIDDAVETEESEEAVLEEGIIKTVDLNSVRDAILNECGITDSMMLETDALTRLYGIDASKVKQSASFVTMSGTFPHEIIMAEAVDEGAATEIASLLQNRLSEVMVQSQSYDAKNYALAQKCEVSRKGNFVSLFLSPEFEKMTGVYDSYIK